MWDGSSVKWKVGSTLWMVSLNTYWLYLVYIPKEKTMLSITNLTLGCSKQLCLGLGSEKVLGFPLNQSRDMGYLKIIMQWNSGKSLNSGQFKIISGFKKNPNNKNPKSKKQQPNKPEKQDLFPPSWMYGQNTFSYCTSLGKYLFLLGAPIECWFRLPPAKWELWVQTLSDSTTFDAKTRHHHFCLSFLEGDLASLDFLLKAQIARMDGETKNQPGVRHPIPRVTWHVMLGQGDQEEGRREATHSG